VSFYLTVGLVIAGYLAASLLSIAFGPRPGRMRVAWRMGSVVLLGVLMGLGAAVALAFGDRPLRDDPEVEAAMAAAAAPLRR
jgi:hypothetical protein